MKKSLINILIILITLIIGLEVLLESSSVLETVMFSFNVWAYNLFPSLFPFFVISSILIDCGFAQFLSSLLSKFMYKVFKVNGMGAFILIMSMLSGFPSSAKYTKELYLNNSINDKEATKLLTFTHFSNPLFILGTISVIFLNNYEAGIIILIIHYFCNIIIGLIFRNYYISNKEDASLKLAFVNMNKKINETNKSFGEIIHDALTSSISTLLLVLGVVTMFLVLTTLINNNLPISDYYKAIINGVFEMTQGLKSISILDIPLKVKSIFCVFFISFGGLSVHMQIISIISGTKIKYYPYFIARIIHGALSSFIMYLSFDILINWF